MSPYLENGNISRTDFTTAHTCHKASRRLPGQSTCTGAERPRRAHAPGSALAGACASHGQFACGTGGRGTERVRLSRGRAAEPSPCRGWCFSAGAGPSPATTWSSRGCSSCACGCSGEGIGLCVRASGLGRERARGVLASRPGGATVSSGYSGAQSWLCVLACGPLPGPPR